MTTTTSTLFDFQLTRFDIPMMDVASDAAHLFVIWPATTLGMLGKLEHDGYERSEAFKRKTLEKQRGECTWCNKPLAFQDIEVDHVWPIARGGRHWVFNLQVLHGPCNKAKSDCIEFAMNNVSPLLPYLLASVRWLLKHPRLLAAIVGGTTLVVVTLLAVKWLREHVDGERRYAILAGKIRSHARGLAQKARGVTGRFGQKAAHRFVETASELPARAGLAAANVQDASPVSLPKSAGNALRFARRAGGLAEDTALAAAGIAKSGASRAPYFAQDVAARAALALPLARVGSSAGLFPKMRGVKPRRHPDPQATRSCS